MGPIAWRCCFWACDKAAHHGGSAWKKKQFSLGRQQRGEEMGSHCSLLAPPQSPSFSWLQILKVARPPLALQAGDQAFSTWAFREMLI